MFDTEIEKELFWQVFRELTFTPIISLPVLYESSAENKIGRTHYDKIKNEKMNDEYIIESKRHKRLFKVLCCGDVNNDPISKLITMPKVYDKQLECERISLFNYMSQYLGYSKIKKGSPSLESLIEAAKLDGGDPKATNETIIKLYPYYYGEAKNGVDFVEYIFLMNISLTTHNRTLGMLDRLIQKPDDKTKINTWIQKVIDSIKSSSSYESYVDTFFSIFYYIVAKKHNQNVDIMKIVKKHQKSNREDDISYYIHSSYCKAWTDEPTIVEMLTETMPTAWTILKQCANNNFDKDINKIAVDCIDVNIINKAEMYAEIISKYIHRAVEGALAILPSMFEESL